MGWEEHSLQPQTLLTRSLGRAKERGSEERSHRTKMITTVAMDQISKTEQQRRNQSVSAVGEIIISINAQSFLNLKKKKEEEKQAAVTWDMMTYVTY